jgi:small-conductance mechanosensitive channel
MKGILLFIIFFFVQFSTVTGLEAQDSIESLNPQKTPVDNKLETPKDIANKLKEEAPDVGDVISGYKVFWTLVFIVIGYFGIKFISAILNLLSEKSTQYRIAFKGAIPIVKILIWVGIVTLIITTIFQPPITTILAFSASVAVAVGFAAQDILKNIFGGVIILLDRPFKSGDKIEVGSFYGEVVEIGLRSTRIVTPDDSLVSIPNSEIMNSPVSNANTGEATCQVVAEIYLPLDIDTMQVRQIATQAARVSKYVYLNKPITVLFFNEVKERKSYLKMRLKAYVRDIRDEFIFKSDMTELVVKELISKDILPNKNREKDS